MVQTGDVSRLSQLLSSAGVCRAPAATIAGPDSGTKPNVAVESPSKTVQNGSSSLSLQDLDRQDRSADNGVRHHVSNIIMHLSRETKQWQVLAALGNASAKQITSNGSSTPDCSSTYRLLTMFLQI